LDPHSIPAARLKACTTIQFSKTTSCPQPARFSISE